MIPNRLQTWVQLRHTTMYVLIQSVPPLKQLFMYTAWTFRRQKALTTSVCTTHHLHLYEIHYIWFCFSWVHGLCILLFLLKETNQGKNSYSYPFEVDMDKVSRFSHGHVLPIWSVADRPDCSKVTLQDSQGLRQVADVLVSSWGSGSVRMPRRGEGVVHVSW